MLLRIALLEHLIYSMKNVVKAIHKHFNSNIKSISIYKTTKFVHYIMN
jgi:hypothetical protein